MDKGALVYQEEWAYKHDYKDRSNLITMFVTYPPGLFFIFIGILGVYRMILDLNFSFEIILQIFVIWGLGFWIVWIGVSSFKKELMRMPFRIYKDGFTIPYVDFKDGFWRRENFVSWDRLNEVNCESDEILKLPLNGITLKYDKDESIYLSLSNLDDPFEVMKALHRFVPGKMDPGFNKFVGSPKERKFQKPTFPYEPGRYDWWYCLSLSFVLFLGSGIVLVVLPINFEGNNWFFLFLPTVLLVSGIFVFW